jgi:hypothetical protein
MAGRRQIVMKRVCDLQGKNMKVVHASRYKVMLKEGPNQILIKTVNFASPVWGLRVRVLNEDGSPVEVE